MSLNRPLLGTCRGWGVHRLDVCISPSILTVMDMYRTQAQNTARRSGEPLTREVVTAILQRALAERPEVVAGYLFGSVARDRANAGSDIDAALLLDADFDLDAYPLYRLDRMTGLAVGLGMPVDVVILNNAPLVLRNQILTYGRQICETDHRQRVAYEVRSRQAYWDFRLILDRIYVAQHRHIKEGTFGHQYRGHRDPLGDAVRARERFEGAEKYDV